MQEEISGKSSPTSGVMSYYNTVVELGTTELIQYRNRVYQNIKINLGVAAAIAILMLYAEGLHYATLFISVLILFGIMHCFLWMRQIRETLANIANWRLDAAQIEQTTQFQDAIGGLDVKLWTRPELMASIEKGTQVEEPSGKHHIWIPTFWLLFYVIVAVVRYLKILGGSLSPV